MTAAQSLLESAAASWQAQALAVTVPGWFRDRQRRALDAALAAGWPAPGAEAWKYTPLRALGQQVLAVAPAPNVEALPDPKPEAPSMTFVDGHRVHADLSGLASGVSLEALSQALRDDSEALRFAIGREAEAGDVFDHLNAAFACDGAWLRAAAGSDDPRWIALRASGSGDPAPVTWHLAHRIDVGEDARLRVCMEARAAASAGLATHSTRIRVQRGGRLDLAWLGAPTEALAMIARTRIELERDVVLRLHVLDAGGSPSRHDLCIVLREAGADVRLGGVFPLAGRRHADVQLDLRHESPDTRSETVWRAIAGDKSRAVFNGHITVAEGADGTDARLGSKSLLTSPQAEVDTKPVLEIYADDVKCAHGATVGQLDANAVFYLRSRGLDEASARALLMRAFAVESLGDAPDDSPVRNALNAWLGLSAP